MMTDTKATETRTFEADVSRLLHMMVHSVYSDRDVFLRELISNSADACEKLRYEAIGRPELLGDDPKPRITIAAHPDKKRLMAEALGTIARSGTRAFVERLEAGKANEDTQLIGQFGVGFYSAFMVADRVDVISRQAGSAEAWLWSSDGKGSYEIGSVALGEAPKRGTRVVLHLMEGAASYTESYQLERLVKSQSGHVPVPISLIEKPGSEVRDIADGTALWVKPKSEIKPEEYTDFYRSVAGQYDEPAATIHFRAEGRQEYSVLAFVPGSRPFDLFDQDRKGRMKLYVRRVFITDDADLLPRYLRFVRGLVDSADLPLNVSREMIQESPLLVAIRKGVTNRILADLAKLAENDAAAYAKIWECQATNDLADMDISYFRRRSRQFHFCNVDWMPRREMRSRENQSARSSRFRTASVNRLQRRPARGNASEGYRTDPRVKLLAQKRTGAVQGRLHCLRLLVEQLRRFVHTHRLDHLGAEDGAEGFGKLVGRFLDQFQDLTLCQRPLRIAAVRVKGKRDDLGSLDG